jgi:hypothetical protein
VLSIQEIAFICGYEKLQELSQGRQAEAREIIPGIHLYLGLNSPRITMSEMPFVKDEDIVANHRE